MPYERPDPFKMLADSLESGQADPRVKWQLSARPDQMAPPGNWRTWYVRGGRGSGKTHTGSNTFAGWILDEGDREDFQPGQWGIVGPTFGSAWTVCVEGESGLLAAFGTSMSEIKQGKSKYVTHAWRSHGEIRLRNGDVVYVDSANDGADRVQGKNLKGAWCDEIGMWVKWELAWDESIGYATRRSGARIIATATPKVSRPAAKLIRRLINDPDVPVAKLRTIDNAANLSEAFIDSVVGRAKGTRLEKQELEGELLDDVAGALWTWTELEELVVRQLPSDSGGQPIALQSVMVGVDPSDGKESGDEQAFTVVGMGADRNLYVLESWGDRISPNAFLRKAVDAAVRWRATLVVEYNHGRGFLDLALQQVQKDMGTNCPVRLVTASKGKRTRAEPVAALYERGYVHHVKPVKLEEEGKYAEDDALNELEDQMCSFTAAAGEKSPDRLDSLVWAITPFLNYSFGNASYRRKKSWNWQQSKLPDAPRDLTTTPKERKDSPLITKWEHPEIAATQNRRVRHYNTDTDISWLVNFPRTDSACGSEGV